MVKRNSIVRADSLLKTAGVIWYLTALIGQGAFVTFIVGFYWSRTFSGRFSAWNDKPLITGYVAGDRYGNLMFAAHVVLAAVVTLGGLLQLLPALRNRFPGFHRWNGRLFFVIAIFMALGGLWLGWIRGKPLSQISAIAISLNAVLILICVVVAWRYAIARRIAEHRPWAMRAFLVVNGVWFLRIGLMGWRLVSHGAGMNNAMSGPADIALEFGSYLIPLLTLEAYNAAGRSKRGLPKIITAMTLLALTAYMAVGIYGAITFLWGPYL